MSEEQKDLYMYMDRGGRYYVGYVESEDVERRTVTLSSILFIQEKVLPTQDPQQQQIMFNVAPIMHTFMIDTWEFQWIGRHKVTDPKLIGTHEDFQKKIRAARSNLSVATSVPAGMANSLAPDVARAVQG